MLTRGMTNSEKHREISKENVWLSERYNGLYKKYRRSLLGRGGDCFLGVSRYVSVRGNVCHIVSKRVGKDLCFSTVVEHSEGNYKHYYIPFGSDNKMVSFTDFPPLKGWAMTSHFCSRLRERLGLSVFEFIGIINNFAFSQGREDNHYNMCFDGGIAFGYIEDGYFIMTTVISSEMLKGEQGDVLDGCMYLCDTFSELF
jgi:hypothetical protein